MKLFSNKIYEVKNLRYNLGNYVIPNKYLTGIAIDIGSNNGCFIEKYIENFSSIHSYEPNIFLFKLLQKKFKNSFNVKIYNEAVDSDCDKIVKLVKHKYTDDNGSFAIFKDHLKNEWNDQEIICESRTVNLEKIIERTNGSIDLLKIDCENSEYDLLINKNLSTIKCIVIEIHHQMGKKKYEELINYISKTHVSQIQEYQDGHNKEFCFINKNNL